VQIRKPLACLCAVFVVPSHRNVPKCTASFSLNTLKRANGSWEGEVWLSIWQMWYRGKEKKRKEKKTFLLYTLVWHLRVTPKYFKEYGSCKCFGKSKL